MALRDQTTAQDQPGPLHICLLGRLSLTLGQEALPLPRSAAAGSLLAYLSVHRGRPLARTVLAGTFWPDRPDAGARKALSDALWQIRQALGPAGDRLAVERDTVTLTLQPTDQLDVAAFDTHLRRFRELQEDPQPAGLATGLAELRAAVALYHADLLPGCYDDWVLAVRERLREQYGWALEQLAASAKQRGDDEQALEYVERLVAVDPLREAGHRELMRLYHALGRPRAALEQYATLRQLLADELGAEPAASSTALCREIHIALGEESPPDLSAALPAPTPADRAPMSLVGRTRERAVLQQALHAAARGRGSIALVEGAAGVGKTRLVEEVSADARWRGFQVGLAQADPLSASAPYQLLRDALMPLLTPLRVAQLAGLVPPIWLSAIAVLFPVLATHLPDLPSLPPLEPSLQQQRLWEGLGRCLAGLGQLAPLLLVLDDVHGADAATLAALAHLPAHVPAGRLLLLLTCRAAEARERPVVWKTLDSLDRALPLRRLLLQPLDLPETCVLVGRALGAAAADEEMAAFARLLHERTAGNALFLLETLSALREAGTLSPRPDGRWDYPAGESSFPIPASIQELVGQRLLRLSPPLRGTLEQVAVCGQEVEFILLARAGRASPVELAGLGGELCRRGFLCETGTDYRFTHALVRDIVYGLIGARRRRQLHRQVLKALASVHPDGVEALAYHAAAGADWAAAARYYQAAGDRATAMEANADAATAYTRALEALQHLENDETPAQRVALLRAREQAYDVLGERPAQERDLLELDRLAQGLGDAQLLAEVALHKASYAKSTCDYPQALADAAEALAAAERVLPLDPGRLRAQAEAQRLRGEVLWLQGETEAARSSLQHALAQARAADLRQVEADCINLLGIIAYYQSDYAEAQEQLETALSLACALDDLYRQGHILNALALVYHDRCDYSGALPYYDRALQIHRRTGNRRGESMVLNNLGLAAHDQGAYSDALEDYQQALRLFRQVGDRRGESMALNNIGRVLAELGRYRQAQGYYEQALQIRREIGQRHGEGVVLSNLGGIYHRLGELETALALTEQALHIAEELKDRDTQGYVLTYLGHILAGLGRLDEAAAAYQQALDIRLEMGLHNQALESRGGLAHVCLLRGDLDQARQHVSCILQGLEAGGKQGVEDLFQVYLTCYRILRACQDPRADAILSTAGRLVEERAAQIRDEELRRSFLENVAAHRQLRAALQQRQGLQAQGQRVARLARADAPTGRPLYDDEFVEVTWTVAASEDDTILDLRARRRHRLRRLLEEAAALGAAPTVADLSAALQTPERTLKRDLAALRAAGHPTPTRGRRGSA